MISLQSVAMSFGSQILFDDVNLHLSPQHRYGLTGANGTGKSTFLNLLAKESTPLLGEIFMSKDLKIGWLKQDQYLFLDETILSVVLRGKKELWQAFEKKEALLKQEALSEKEIEKLGKVEETIDRLDGYLAEAQAASLLTGLGVCASMHDLPLKFLSGGFKLRVLLARTLFDQPDILLLDEPTNYLDIQKIDWLAHYLTQNFSGLLVVTSHDRHFLNRVCTSILDIDYGEIRAYTGNYDQFSRQKEKMVEVKEKQRKEKEKYVQRIKLFIERFKSKPSKAKQALSREKQLEKMEWPKLDVSSRREPKFHFTQEHKPGRIVFELKDLCKSYENKDVLNFINLKVKRGEHLAILGENGVGKSTLLKLILKKAEPTLGEVNHGLNIEIGYFAQESHEQLNGKQSICDWLEKESGATTQVTRATLGKVLFTEDDHHKTLNVLSGGEKARLVLAKLMLEKCNCLILDEPTNHLDLEARDALAKALSLFEGTIIFVSHDQAFVSKLASKMLYLAKGEFFSFHGSYEEFMKKHAELNSNLR